MSGWSVNTGYQVSFNSKVDEGLRIQQLSGGQKSLVALATGKNILLSWLAVSHQLSFSLRDPKMRPSSLLSLR